MTFDPTTNRVPFGLLTDEELNILKAAKHGWQRYSYGEWVDAGSPDATIWYGSSIYRAKPAPVVQTWWVNINPDDLWSARKYADAFALNCRIGVVRVDLIDGKMTVTAEQLEGEKE